MGTVPGGPGDGGTLILSPHPDDAALSLGGCIGAGLLPQPVTVVTVFGRSSWMDGGFQPDVEAVTARRRAEDVAFARAAGVGLRSLDLPEAALRPPGAGNGIFAADDDDLVGPDELEDRLDAVVAEVAPEGVVAPLGLGDHRDHLLLQRFALRRAGRGPEVAFYEDLPYAAAVGYGSIVRRVRRLDGSLSPRPVPIGGVERKLDLLRHYPSQVRPAEVLAVSRHARREPGRRGWRRLTRFRRPGASERLWSASGWPVAGSADGARGGDGAAGPLR